jgi:DNA-binding response OmpR family regulator
MSKPFAELLQEAVDQGQIVLVPPRQHVVSALPPLRTDRDAAALTATFAVILRLNNAQGRMLTEMMLRDCCSREELRAVAAPRDTSSTVDVVISQLRKKLKPFNIKIITVHKIGYALDKKAREKVYRLITQHDEAIAAVLLQTKSEPVEPKQ